VVSLLVVVALTSALKAPRLVEWNGEPAKWMTEVDIQSRLNASKTPWVNFQDLTDYPNSQPGRARSNNPSPIPSQPTQQAIVEPRIANVLANNIVTNINTLSALFTRFENADGGVQGAQEIQRIFNAYKGTRTDVTVQLYSHPNWRQPSVMATVVGTESDEIVVLSAHEDSIGRCRNAGCRSPGADDDASGVCAMLEAFRVLMAPDANNNLWRPKRTLMFLAFAAEETGLRGSTDMVNRFFQGGNVNIMGILQSEMNGYQVERQMTLIRDQFTNIPVTEFTSK